MPQFEDFKEIVAADHGHYISALCLWHDDQSPSLLVYKDGFFICQGCGEQGGFAKLYQKLCQVRGHRALLPQKHDAPMLDLPRWDDHAALVELARSASLTLYKYPGMKWYLHKRGLTDGTIVNLGLGWYKEWIVVPILDRSDELAGLVLRATPSMAKATGLRYLIPAGQPPLPYVPNWGWLDREKVLFGTFGVFDAITLNQLGYAAITSTNGKDHFNSAWLDDQRKPFGLIPDKGEYETAAKTLAGFDWRGHILELAYPKGVKDPNGFLESSDPGLYHNLDAQLHTFKLKHLPR